MSDASNALIADLRGTLSRLRYNRTVIHNYCLYAGQFLEYLEERGIALDAVTPDVVSEYLSHAVCRFRMRHGRLPAGRWTSIPRSGIHALLRIAVGNWPPEPPAISCVERLCRETCDQYERWLRTERGLAEASIAALMWEARHFCFKAEIREV